MAQLVSGRGRLRQKTYRLGPTFRSLGLQSKQKANTQVNGRIRHSKQHHTLRGLFPVGPTNHACDR